MLEKTAYFACGCFWGTQYYFSKLNGVLSTIVGYQGGHLENPTYKQVCNKDTGHYESIKVNYDSNKINYENLVKYFFEIHDFTQTNGQGPDIGPQYLSAIFYQNQEELEICEKVINILNSKGFKVATKLLPYSPFYSAENYHQMYYDNKGSSPYCHFHKKIF